LSLPVVIKLSKLSSVLPDGLFSNQKSKFE
jgi:hypothetical protein